MGFFIQGNNLEKENGKWQRPQWESRIDSHIFFLNLVQFRSLLVKHFYKVVWYAGFGRTKNFTRSDLKSKEHILLPLKRGKSWFLFYLKIYDFNCLLQGPSFILHKLYNTEWSNWSTFGRHRPLVATSCSCLCGTETRCQCLKEVGSMHLVGASSVHSSIFSYCWLEYHHNIFIRDNYSKPTWGLARFHFTYPWFKTLHFAHLNFNPLPIRYPPFPLPLEKHIFWEK